LNLLPFTHHWHLPPLRFFRSAKSARTTPAPPGLSLVNTWTSRIRKSSFRYFFRLFGWWSVLLGLIVSSLSRMKNVTSAGSSTTPGPLSCTVKDSEPSASMSSWIVTGISLARSFGPKLTVPEAAVKSLPLCALPGVIV
jgi:hypothetical protein